MRSKEEILNSRRVLIGREGIDGFTGEIHLLKWRGSVICSTGGGWEHVSVAPYKRSIVPSWEDMCDVKDLFFADDEWVVQFHPAKDEYVSNVNNCLHLWRPTKEKLPVPPSIMTGIRNGQSISSVIEELKKLEGE